MLYGSFQHSITPVSAHNARKGETYIQHGRKLSNEIRADLFPQSQIANQTSTSSFSGSPVLSGSFTSSTRPGSTSPELGVTAFEVPSDWAVVTFTRSCTIPILNAATMIEPNTMI